MKNVKNLLKKVVLSLAVVMVVTMTDCQVPIAEDSIVACSEWPERDNIGVNN